MKRNPNNLPTAFTSVEELEEFLSRPREDVMEALRQLSGDLLILGVGGKMGPTLAMLAQRCVTDAGLKNKVIGVDLFPDRQVEGRLQKAGVQTLHCDVTDPKALEELPDVDNLIFMVGMKFGTTGKEPATWAINSFVPGLVARRFAGTRTVVFSSGNVYPMVPVLSGGCLERTPPAPLGEYAQSVLGRERNFAYFANQSKSPVLFFRLNYSVEMRYGVLWDIAQKVWNDQPVNVSMGHANVLWQGDANAYALRCLALAESPPRILNVTGPETLCVRQVAHLFGTRMKRDVLIEGEEQSTALLSNAQEAFRLLGYPTMPASRVIQWLASWVSAGGESLGKPTKFQVRDGKF